MFLTRCIFPSISSQLEGALPGTLWNVGVGAAPAGGGKRSPRTREALGFRPGPLRGTATVSWLGGDRRAARNRRAQASAAKSPEERTKAKRSPRRNAERRCRVPLFPGSPGSKPRPLPRCAFRRSASLFSVRGRFSETPTHAKEFAGGDDACPAEGAV
jgi:hypothetical protein